LDSSEELEYCIGDLDFWSDETIVRK
jgi:hypothetical protein